MKALYFKLFFLWLQRIQNDYGDCDVQNKEIFQWFQTDKMRCYSIFNTYSIFNKFYFE